ncbi:unnamed protein product [Pleuronectes platessa]|uniref:Uncharacterized protein n=1 Tax=Pleuronectes platessa TaxID=8262 RepID=A0A9N7UR90_PLEPL|nr:unnamed protein product [Pleuronectes platessa]
MRRESGSTGRRAIDAWRDAGAATSPLARQNVLTDEIGHHEGGNVLLLRPRLLASTAAWIPPEPRSFLRRAASINVTGSGGSARLVVFSPSKRWDTSTRQDFTRPCCAERRRLLLLLLLSSGRFVGGGIEPPNSTARDDSFEMGGGREGGGGE